tara:strand:- start:99 stop:626 length:528 start_codon:yes stop_codon:yes gene_type:complete
MVNLDRKNLLFIFFLSIFCFVCNANEKQIDFIKIINDSREGFSSSFNDLKINKLLVDRNDMLCKSIPQIINNWEGKIKGITTNMEGKGILSIIISKGIFIQTWNNAFSDLFDNTLIETDSKVYSQLLELNRGDSILFSGSFIENSSECFGTQNFTNKSKISKPEFTFIFSNIIKN